MLHIREKATAMASERASESEHGQGRRPEAKQEDKTTDCPWCAVSLQEERSEGGAGAMMMMAVCRAAPAGRPGAAKQARARLRRLTIE